MVGRRRARVRERAVPVGRVGGFREELLPLGVQGARARGQRFRARAEVVPVLRGHERHHRGDPGLHERVRQLVLSQRLGGAR